VTERPLSGRYADAVIDYERRGSKEDKELLDKLSAEIDNWAEANQAASKLWRDAMEREARLRAAIDGVLAEMQSDIDSSTIGVGRLLRWVDRLVGLRTKTGGER
jgi:hypothetical protein